MKYKRTGSIVENYKQVAKDDPRYTLEYGLEGMLQTWTLQDVLQYEMNEEKFGKDTAVDMYSELWRRRTYYEFYDLKEQIGVPKDQQLTMEEVMKMIVIYFNAFGNPFEIVKNGPDLYEGHVADCPYTTQIVWKLFDRERADHFNEAVQVSCNTAIFEEFLRLANLDKEWLFSFGNQLCRYGGSCSFIFRKKIPEKV